ncbi:MAG: hypothetical protein HYX89_04110 [Chloroflexi bacterium]|nr:hypothetical protein [Chloroflexota bacterium]
MNEIRRHSLSAILPRFQGQRILVLGDLALDRYLIGEASRLSREAPIPVLEYRREFSIPGAAANPAQNVQALGGQALLAGVVGADADGEAILEKLRAGGIDTSGVLRMDDRPTTTKTRLLAEGPGRFPQQVARMDRLSNYPMDSTSQHRLIAHLESHGTTVDALLLSDYKAGLLTPEVVAASIRWGKERDRLVLVDSQGDLYKFRGCAVVKANQKDAESALGQRLGDDASFRDALLRLREELSAGGVVVTRGAEGMSLTSPQGYAHIPAYRPGEVFDVTGAGDTVIAVLTMAMVAGATLTEAAKIASVAAGLVVRRMGNATVSLKELEAALEDQ